MTLDSDIVKKVVKNSVKEQSKTSTSLPLDGGGRMNEF
jgi:hypothetical protein